MNPINLRQLAEQAMQARGLLPAFAPALQQQAEQEQIRRFVAVRCTTPTRLPELTQLGSGLWLNTGFGSRGLSHAPLAAEHLAQEILSER